MVMIFKENMMNYDQRIIDQVIELKKIGTTHRDISEIVFGKRTAASSVFYILNEHYYPTLNKKVPPVKILTLDIESSMCLTAVFGIRKQFIDTDQLIVDAQVLSVAAKWLHEDEVMYADAREEYDGSAASILCDNPKDLEVMVKIWNLLDEADIVIGHNLDSFDIKKLNARFFELGLPMPKPYRTIDTLKIARKHFKFTSNKLGYLTKKFNVKYAKSEHGKFAGKQLWLECLKGNVEAFDEMEHYNIHDVLATEELFIMLAPYTNNLPNLDIYTHKTHEICYCGARDSFEEVGKQYTNARIHETLECQACGMKRRGKKLL